jgi:hypothetical protein
VNQRNLFLATHRFKQWLKRLRIRESQSVPVAKMPNRRVEGCLHAGMSCSLVLMISAGPSAGSLTMATSLIEQIQLSTLDLNSDPYQAIVTFDFGNIGPKAGRSTHHGNRIELLTGKPRSR